MQGLARGRDKLTSTYVRLDSLWSLYETPFTSFPNPEHLRLRLHVTARFFNQLKNLSGHFIHTKLARVVQTLDSDVHRKNRFPADKH